MKKNEQKIKIAFIYHRLATFIKKDLETLQKHFDVEPIQWTGKRDILKIAKGIMRSDLSFNWFAGDHAAVSIFFSKLFKKKSIIVVGGYDVASEPEIDYGQLAQKEYKKKLTQFALKNANLVLAVDRGLIKDAETNAKVTGEHIDYLPTGYDPKYWKAKGIKEKIVLTIASADNLSRIKIKGLDTFVKSAKYLPSTKFIVVGVNSEAKKYLEKISSKNVELIEFLPQKKLLSYYQKAKVYCQLSLREGLPNCLCEAMLCNCIPVGTDIPGIKNAIGNTGFYVTYNDEKATADAIKKALAEPDKKGEMARKRITDMFRFSYREKGLTSFISNLTKKEGRRYGFN